MSWGFSVIQGSPLALNPHFKARVELQDSAGTGGRHVYTHSNQLYGDLLDFSLFLWVQDTELHAFLFFHISLLTEIWFNIFLIKHTRGERLIYVLAVGKISTLALAVVLFSIKTPWAHTICHNWTVKYRFYGGKMKHWQRAMRKKNICGIIRVQSNFSIIYRLIINVQYFKNKFYHIRRHWGWLKKEVLFSYPAIGPLKRLYY